MIRRIKLLTVDVSTERICAFLSETNCNCECPDCTGTCTDCVDCPNLTIADIFFWIYRSGDFNQTTHVPNYLLVYPCFTITDNKVCFLPDNLLLALPAGRYEAEVQVKSKKAGLINFQLGVPYSICDPFTSTSLDGSNDMQPSNP